MPKMLEKLNELENMSKEDIESVKNLIESSGFKK
jgi:endonuclease III